MSLTEQIKGEEREALEALRDHLTAALEEAEPRYKAPLARQLRDVLKDLKAIAPAKEKSKTDDLAAKRARRRANVSKRSA